MEALTIVKFVNSVIFLRIIVGLKTKHERVGFINQVSKSKPSEFFLKICGNDIRIFLLEKQN